MKKNLILAASTHFGWHELEPFFVSMKQNLGDVECVTFIDDTSDWTKDQILVGGGIQN